MVGTARGWESNPHTHFLVGRGNGKSGPVAAIAASLGTLHTISINLTHLPIIFINRHVGVDDMSQ